MRTFQFGIMAQGPGLLEIARQAEELGYSTLCLPDHLGEQWAPLVSLAAVAMVTSRLRLAPLVCCNDFRHPAVLAKELATLDVLSQGRLQVGLGAGWMESDYRKSGLPMDPPAQRIQRLEEALAVLRGALAPGPFSFHGTHYRMEEYTGFPQPVQSPIPLYLGGGGGMMLRLAARQADVVGININLRNNALCDLDFSAEACDQKVSWVRQAAGPRWDQIRLSMLTFVCRLTDQAESAYHEIAAQMETTAEVVRQSPSVLVGTVDQVVEQLVQRRQRWGISEWIFRSGQLRDFAPVVAQLQGS
ncbi:TIGR03621 family F420-dependent LLM class oxidoreductase [bacterium]|nr:TIGR03621 family F420-dependent LLM class oxidoreductase [bacterium]